MTKKEIEERYNKQKEINKELVEENESVENTDRENEVLWKL